MITDEIKKTIGIKKGTGNRDVVGDISLEKLKELAKKHMDKTNTTELKSCIKELIGTCISMGITINGKKGKEIMKDVEKLVV